MKVITAAATRMCFGVRDALAVLAGIDQPRSVAIYGELVHNDVVLHQLEARGFKQVKETDRAELPVARTFNPAESKPAEPCRIGNPAYGRLPAADRIVITLAISDEVAHQISCEHG